MEVHEGGLGAVGPELDLLGLSGSLEHSERQLVRVFLMLLDCGLCAGWSRLLHILKVSVDLAVGVDELVQHHFLLLNLLLPIVALAY